MSLNQSLMLLHVHMLHVCNLTKVQTKIATVLVLIVLLLQDMQQQIQVTVTALTR